MPDPIHTPDGKLAVIYPGSHIPGGHGRLATLADVEQACRDTISQAWADGEKHGQGDLAEVLAERDEARQRSCCDEWVNGCDYHAENCAIGRRDAEHLSIIAELSGMVLGRLDPTTQCEYCGLPFEHGPCPQCNANDHELRAALAAAQAEVERLSATARVQAQHIANQRDKCQAYDAACRAIFTNDPADEGKAGDLADHINGLRADVARLTRERDAMARVVEAAREYRDLVRRYFALPWYQDGIDLVQQIEEDGDALDSPQPDQPTPPEPTAEPSPEACGGLSGTHYDARDGEGGVTILCECGCGRSVSELRAGEGWWCDTSVAAGEPVPAQRKHNSGRQSEDSGGFFTCEHCGCNTNARLRKCCSRGYIDDGGKWPPMPGTAPVLRDNRAEKPSEDDDGRRCDEGCKRSNQDDLRHVGQWWCSKGEVSGIVPQSMRPVRCDHCYEPRDGEEPSEGGERRRGIAQRCGLQCPKCEHYVYHWEWSCDLKNNTWAWNPCPDWTPRTKGGSDV